MERGRKEGSGKTKRERGREKRTDFAKQNLPPKLSSVKRLRSSLFQTFSVKRLRPSLFQTFLLLSRTDTPGLNDCSKDHLHSLSLPWPLLDTHSLSYRGHSWVDTITLSPPCIHFSVSAFYEESNFSSLSLSSCPPTFSLTTPFL